MIKTITFAIMCFSVVFSITYSIFIIGGVVASVELAINAVIFYFHDMFWNKRQEAGQETVFTKGFQAVSESYALRAM